MRRIVWIAMAGSVAATLDIMWQFGTLIAQGRSPDRVLLAISSGLLGREAFQGGWAIAGLGLVLHYVILIIAAGLMVLAARIAPPLLERSLWSGVALGAAIYIVMHALVVPLSAAPFQLVHTTETVALGLSIHILLVGIPMAWILSRRLPNLPETHS